MFVLEQKKLVIKLSMAQNPFGGPPPFAGRNRERSREKYVGHFLHRDFPPKKVNNSSEHRPSLLPSPVPTWSAILWSTWSTTTPTTVWSRAGEDRLGEDYRVLLNALKTWLTKS